VSLVASVLEAHGIATVVVSALPQVTRQLTAPRTLDVPFGLGTPMGPAHDRLTQNRVLAQALAMTTETAVPLSRPWRA
jgi:hypothetical protein